MLEGIQDVSKVFESETFKGKMELCFPKKEELHNKEKLSYYVYRSLIELFHPTGTCKMGDVENDKTAVVDQNLKVKGFENLRVIDASVIPEITNSNTNAPTIMIAEKGADLVLKGDISEKKFILKYKFFFFKLKEKKKNMRILLKKFK